MALIDANDLHENGRPRKEVASNHLLSSPWEMKSLMPKLQPVLRQSDSLLYLAWLPLPWPHAACYSQKHLEMSDVTPTDPSPLIWPEICLYRSPATCTSRLSGTVRRTSVSFTGFPVTVWLFK